jgi:hypothetical protein
MDTVRADHLALYGYPRDTTPNLKQLAGDSVVYTRAQAPSDMTLSSRARPNSALSQPDRHFAWRAAESSQLGFYVGLLWPGDHRAPKSRTSQIAVSSQSQHRRLHSQVIRTHRRRYSGPRRLWNRVGRDWVDGSLWQVWTRDGRYRETNVRFCCRARRSLSRRSAMASNAADHDGQQFEMGSQQHGLQILEGCACASPALLACDH